MSAAEPLGAEPAPKPEPKDDRELGSDDDDDEARQVGKERPSSGEMTAGREEESVQVEGAELGGREEEASASASEAEDSAAAAAAAAAATVDGLVKDLASGSASGTSSCFERRRSDCCMLECRERETQRDTRNQPAKSEERRNSLACWTCTRPRTRR